MSRRRKIKMILTVCATLNYISAAYGVTVGTPDDCPATQEISSCEELRTSEGFTYHAPPHMKQITDDCEHGWYHQNGTFIADSTGNGTRPKSLTMNKCLDIQLQIRCPMNPEFDRDINFTVSKVSRTISNDTMARNKTASPEGEQVSEHKEDSNGLPKWGIALIVIVIVIAIVIVVAVARKYCHQRPNPRDDNGVV